MSEHEVDKERRMDGTKLLWHMDRVKARFDEGERVAPIHIDAGISKFCNVRCVFCYGQYQNMMPKVMIERDALLGMVRDAGEIGVRSLAFIGDGEPTVNPAFYDALYEGKEAGLSLSTSTNGVLLATEEKRAAILENCEWMRFCISAGTREGYKAIHGVDKFEQVKRNIADIVNERDKRGLDCDIGLQAVFVPTIMAEEMIAEAKLAKDLGADYLVIKQCSLPDDGESGMLHFDVNIYDDPRVQGALAEAESLSDERTKIIPKWNLMLQKGQKPYTHCSSIALISEISGNGDWYPCGYMFGGKEQFERYRFGNVHDKPLKEIWESERYWEIVSHMEDDFNVQQDCKGCCRQDKCNEFIHTYRNPPRGLNFI